MPRITLSNVATEAGVSVGTASLVLNGRSKEKRLSDDCVRRVHAAAEKLGYQGSYHARTLLRGKAMTLGLVTRFQEHDTARARIEAGLADRAERRGYEILNITRAGALDGLDAASRYVRQGRLDAFAVFMGGWIDSPQARAIGPEVPMAHIWFHPDGFEPVVTLDAEPGIRAAVRHLAGLGHRRLGWLSIAGAAGPAVPERLAAFRDEVHRGGLTAEERFLPAPAERIRPSDCAVSTFYHTLRASDDWTGQATALLCYNDQMALAAGLVLRDRGIVVPRDISLVGFDDAQALYAVPPLTTITHGFAQMGAAAVDLLERMIATPAPTRPTGVTRVPAELIIRESTAPPGGPLRASPTAAAHTRGPTPNATP